MITDFIINVIYTVVVVIVNIFAVLPDVTISADLSTALQQISPYYASMAVLFPMGVLLSILAFELVYEGFYLLYKLVRWAYIKIPFIN